MGTPIQVLERVRAGLAPPQEGTVLSPPEELEFQEWYSDRSRALGLDANPDPSERNRYDYRGAWRAGAEPDESRHWPSEFKLEGHPKLVVGGVDTRTGDAVKPQDVLARVRERQAIHAPGGEAVELPTVSVTGDAPEGPPAPRWDPESGRAPYMPFNFAGARNRQLAEHLRPGGPTATALQTMMVQFIPGRERREAIEDYVIEHADEGVAGEFATLLGVEAALGTAGREIVYMAALGRLVRPVGAAFARLSQLEMDKLPRLAAWLAEKAFKSTAASRSSAAVSAGARGAVEGTAFGVGRQALEEGPEGITPGQLFPYTVAGTGFGGLIGALTGVNISPARALVSPQDAARFQQMQRRIQAEAQGGRLSAEQELAYAGEVLGINPRVATEAEVGTVMRSRAAQYHPEGPRPDTELFKIYTEAAATVRQHISRTTPRTTARTAEEAEAWHAAQRDPATGKVTTDPRVTEPTYMRRGTPQPEPPPAVRPGRAPAPGAAGVAVTQPAAPAEPVGPQVTRGRRGRGEDLGVPTREAFLGQPRIFKTRRTDPEILPQMFRSAAAVEPESWHGGELLIHRGIREGGADIAAYVVTTPEGELVAHYMPGMMATAPKFRRQGIMTDLVEDYHVRNPGTAPAPSRSRQAQRIMEEVADRLQGRGLLRTPGAPTEPVGPVTERGVRGRHNRDLIDTPRPEDHLPDVEERPLTGAMFSLEARSDIVPSVTAADIQTQQILVRRMMEAHRIGEPDDPVLTELGIDPATVSVVESTGGWEGAGPNMVMRFDPSIPYEQAREAMMSYSVRLGQRSGFMMQMVEPSFPEAKPTRSVELTEAEYYRLNDAIVQNPEKYPSIQGSSMLPTPAGRKHAVWVDFSGNHEYFSQQLQDAFIEAGIDGEASMLHTRSEGPNAASYRQTTSRGFEEGVGRDLRELRETSVPVWAEAARGQGSETSDDIFAALEGYSAAVRHGTGVVPYSNTFRVDSHAIFTDLGKPPAFAQWRDAMAELGYDAAQLTPKKFEAHSKDWAKLVAELRPAEHMRSVSEVVQLMRRGAAGKDWFYGFTDAMRPFMGDDAEVFTRIWAVSSQQAKFLEADGRPGKQLKDALRSYLEWKNGLEFTNTFLRNNLDRSVLGTGIGLAETPAAGVVGGRKIGNFVPASLGDPDAVTVDLWIQRGFGFETDKAPSLAMYDFIEHTIRRAAQILDWSGRQGQAAMWENLRKESGIPGSPITAANGTVEMLKRVDWSTALEGQTWESIRAIVDAAGNDPVPAWPVLQDVAEGFKSGGLGEGREWFARPEVINRQVEQFAGEMPRYASGARLTELHPKRFTQPEGSRGYFERGPSPAGAITGETIVGPRGGRPGEVRHLEGEPPKPKAPPRAGPPKPESRPAARRRLTTALEAIEELAVQTEATKRVALDDPLRGEIAKVLRQVLVPAQVKAVLATEPRATTQLQAQTILERAMAQIEGELHRRAVDELQTKYKKALQQKMRPEFLSKVQAAVEDIDFKTMSEKTRKSLEATARFLEGQAEGTAPIPEFVLTQMRRMDLTSLKAMGFDEIYGIVDAIDLAVHLNRTKNKLLGKHRGRTRAQVAERIVKDIHTRLPTLRRPKTRELEGRPTRGKLGLLLKEAATRPEVLMEAASEGLRQLGWEDITVEGHFNQERLNWQYRDALTDKLKAVGHPMGTRAFEKWRNEPLELKTPRGPVQLSRDEAIWLLTSLKDPSNRRMFLKNGATIERSDRTFQIDENTIADLNQQMGKPEQAIAQFLHDQFNGPLKEALNKAWVETYGFEVAKVEDYAPRSIDMTRQTTSSDPLEQLAADREGTLRSWGHLKERVGAGGPIRIGGAMDTYINHAEHVARLAAYLVPVNNLNAIIGRVDVKQALLKTIGREGYNRILNSVQMQTVRYPETTDSGRWLRQRMRNFGGSVLGIRLTTWFLNPSGIPISATYQEKGFQNMVASLRSGVNPREWKRIVNLAEKFSPYWRSRYTNFVHESTSGMTSDRTRSYGPRGITELGLEPLQKSDQFGAIIRWKMAERFIGQQHPGVQAGTNEYNNLVAREWERMMFRGENTGHGGDMTGALALGRRNPYFAPLVMFTSSVSKIYSAGVRARLQLQRGDVKGSTKSFIGLVAALLWAAGVREGFARMRKPQDQPITTALPERALKDFLGFVPVLGPNVLQPLFSKAMGKSAFTYPVGTLASTMADMTNTGVAVITTLEKAMDDELDARGEEAYKKSLKRSIEGVAEVGAMWFGVPWGWQDIPNLIRWITPDKPDLRAELRELETPTTVTQENRRIVNSIQTWNQREFRRAIEELDVKGRRPTHAQVVAIINRRYGWLTKYEPGKDARDRLDERQAELVDAALEERAEMRELADSMATANADLLAPTPRRR